MAGPTLHSDVSPSPANLKLLYYPEEPGWNVLTATSRYLCRVHSIEGYTAKKVFATRAPWMERSAALPSSDMTVVHLIKWVSTSFFLNPFGYTRLVTTQPRSSR